MDLILIHHYYLIRDFNLKWMSLEYVLALIYVSTTARIRLVNGHQEKNLNYKIFKFIVNLYHNLSIYESQVFYQILKR